MAKLHQKMTNNMQISNTIPILTSLPP